MQVPINWVAVIVAIIASQVIGFAWYSEALFGKPWRKFSGISNNKPSNEQMMKMTGLGILTAFFMAFVLSYAVVFAGSYLGERGFTLGLMTGFWNWLGFMFPILLGAYVYEKKPMKLVWINGGYWLLTVLVMGVIIAVWK